MEMFVRPSHAAPPLGPRPRSGYPCFRRMAAGGRGFSGADWLRAEGGLWEWRVEDRYLRSVGWSMVYPPVGWIRGTGLFRYLRLYTQVRWRCRVDVFVWGI